MRDRYVIKSRNILAGTLFCICLFADEDQLQGQQFQPGSQVGTVQSAAVNEASGIAASARNSDVLWVHNDSGDSARVFAMNTQGTHLGIYNLVSAGARDWEDMAVGPGPVPGQSYLYLGDIGDNNAVRSSIKVYRVAEPLVSSSQTPVTQSLTGVQTIELQYPTSDGARDAETLMIDPLTNDIYVVSKRESQSRLYRAAYPQSTAATTTLEFITQLPWGWATGGDISPDGDEILVRGYWNASLWSRPSGGTIADAFNQTPVDVPLVSEPQGEAITFDASGSGYYTVSEKLYQPIYYFERICPPGDANRDGRVDADDASILAANWLTVNAAWTQGDFNADGTVNDIDATLLAANWQTVVALQLAVPEPRVLILLLSGLSLLAASRFARRPQ